MILRIGNKLGAVSAEELALVIEGLHEIIGDYPPQ